MPPETEIVVYRLAAAVFFTLFMFALYKLR